MELRMMGVWLLSGLLLACASGPVPREDAATPEVVSSFEEGCEGRVWLLPV